MMACGSTLRSSPAPSSFVLSRSTIPSPRYDSRSLARTENGSTAIVVGDTGAAGRGRRRPSTDLAPARRPRRGEALTDARAGDVVVAAVVGAGAASSAS